MALNDAISYWAFDESGGDAFDSTGNVKTLTNTSTVTYVAGKIALAADFERADSNYFTRMNDTYYDVTSGTINCWINIESDTGTDVYTIWDNAGLALGGLDFRIDGDMKLSAYFGAGLVTIVGTTALSTATWYMATFTWNTLRKELFLNATSDAAEETDQTLTAGTSSVYIGRRQGTAENFDGIIDEFGFWNRVLSGAEITELYNGGAGLNPYPSLISNARRRDLNLLDVG